MLVSDIMMQRFAAAASVRDDDDLQTVSKKIQHSSVGAVVVLSGTDQLVGIISCRELVEALVSRERVTIGLRAQDIMRRDVATCRPDQCELDMLLLMLERQANHVAVTIGERVVDLITFNEVIRNHLQDISNFMRRLAIEARSEQRRAVLGKQSTDTVDILRMFKLISQSQDDAGFAELDVRARHVFMEIGDAERLGRPISLRDLMRYHRLGGYSIVRKVIRQLENRGLLTHQRVQQGTNEKENRVVLTDAGREVLEYMRRSLMQSFKSSA